jgi:hypothetical protein
MQLRVLILEVVTIMLRNVLLDILMPENALRRGTVAVVNRIQRHHWSLSRSGQDVRPRIQSKYLEISETPQAIEVTARTHVKMSCI